MQTRALSQCATGRKNFDRSWHLKEPRLLSEAQWQPPYLPSAPPCIRKQQPSGGLVWRRSKISIGGGWEASPRARCASSRLATPADCNFRGGQICRPGLVESCACAGRSRQVIDNHRRRVVEIAHRKWVNSAPQLTEIAQMNRYRVKSRSSRRS